MRSHGGAIGLKASVWRGIATAEAAAAAAAVTAALAVEEQQQ